MNISNMSTQSQIWLQLDSDSINMINDKTNNIWSGLKWNSVLFIYEFFEPADFLDPIKILEPLEILQSSDFLEPLAPQSFEPL